MTGHQENPGTGKTLQGKDTPIIDIEKLVIAIGIKPENIRVVDPYKLEGTEKAVKDAYNCSEPFVIIAKQPCALKKDVIKNRSNLKSRIVPPYCMNC